VIVAEESESSLDEDNLAEDGKLVKHIQEQEEEPARPMNLNFEVEQGVEESKDDDDSDSSMASIFGDGDEDENEDINGGGSATAEVGSKRSIGESSITGVDGYDAKRQKKSS
jgi:hypothetical protein